MSVVQSIGDDMTDTGMTSLLHRFASLFNSYVGLQSALEDARNLLLIGADCR